VVQGTVIGILHLGAAFLLLSLILDVPALFAAVGVGQPSVHVGLVVLGLLAIPLEVGLSIVLHAWSRRNERDADRFAVATVGSGQALGRGLERLSADSLVNLTPHPLYVVLHYTHPPLVERLRALRVASAAPTATPAGRDGDLVVVPDG
jgi:STE24 endopeptidase